MFKKAVKAHQMGDLESAKHLYLEDLKGNSDNKYEALFNIGMIELQKNNFASATNFFTKVIALNSNDVAAIANAGICYQQIGDFKQAELFLTMLTS